MRLSTLKNSIMTGKLAMLLSSNMKQGLVLNIKMYLPSM